MASGLNAEVTREEGLGIGPWIMTDAKIYVVGPDQPNVFVQLDDPTAFMEGRAPGCIYGRAHPRRGAARQ